MEMYPTSDIWKPDHLNSTIIKPGLDFIKGPMPHFHISNVQCSVPHGWVLWGMHC